jgi:hypothetical protein
VYSECSVLGLLCFSSWAGTEEGHPEVDCAAPPGSASGGCGSEDKDLDGVVQALGAEVGFAEGPALLSILGGSPSPFGRIT